MNVWDGEVPAKFVPAAAVTRMGRVLFIITGYFRNIRYFKCKGKICKNLKDDQSGEDVILCYIDTQELKYKYRRGFETPLVYTLTNVYPISVVPGQRQMLRPE